LILLTAKAPDSMTGKMHLSRPKIHQGRSCIPVCQAVDYCEEMMSSGACCDNEFPVLRPASLERGHIRKRSSSQRILSTHFGLCSFLRSQSFHPRRGEYPQVLRLSQARKSCSNGAVEHSPRPRRFQLTRLFEHWQENLKRDQDHVPGFAAHRAKRSSKPL